MPLYQYDSFSRRGKRIKGIIDASSVQTAKELLRGQDLMPVKVEPVEAEEARFSLKGLFEKKIDSRSKIVFTKQLSVLLRSGVPLLQGLELLADQFEGKFKRILVSIKDGVKAGGPLADQLARYPKVFSNVYVQLVKAGEASGKLDNLLFRLTAYLEKEEETRKRIKKAISYPLTLLFFAGLVVVGLLTFLVPRITEMFSKIGKELPIPTQMLIWMSDTLLNNYILLSIGFISLVIGFMYWKSTPKGKHKIDETLLRFPLTSYFSRTNAVVQFCKTLGMLLDSGVNLSEALDIVCKIVDNKVLAAKLQEAKESIIKEGKISKYLRKTGIFPAMASYMISTGEQSGKLAQMLLTVGSDYEIELTEITDSLTAKIGPIMTIVMGAIVAFILLSIFLPIMEMGDLTGF